MRLGNLIVTISCAIIGAAVLSYSLAQSRHLRPQPRQANARIRPHDAALQARDYQYERLVEQGDGLRGANPAAAAACYRQAISVNPQPTDAWMGLARASDAQGKQAEALFAYRKVFASSSGSGMYSNFPSDVEALARYGTLCEDAGRHDAAVRACSYAGGRLNPKPKVSVGVPLDRPVASPELHAMLDMVRGIALDQQGKGSESLAAFRQAAGLQPDDARVQFYLGDGLRKAGQFTQARAALEKGAALDQEGTVKAAAAESLRAIQAHRR